MTKTSSLSSTVAKRYARSLFELASEGNHVRIVENELAALAQTIKDNEDLSRLVFSPAFTSLEQLRAVVILVEKIGLVGRGAKALVGNFLKVIAANRRLYMLPAMIAAYKDLAARSRGEGNAKIISAKPLNASQQKELKAMLKTVAGADVLLDMVVDPAILGGLVVRLGSRQIDTSLSTKLSSLKLILKEAD